MSKYIDQHWFYTQEPVRMSRESNLFAYHLIPGREPRPGNFEDELVSEFLIYTNQPEWVGDDIERFLRIALRRAADAAVRTTLDAEKPASVVYETAEERAAKKAEDDGAGGVNLTLGYAAVALIERLERIADALEAKAVRP